MKGFFKWFKSETKIKRWMLLILVGIVLVCYGISKIIVTDVMGLKELATIILSFIVGFTLVVLSIVFIQKRTLELLVKESDTRDIENENKIKTLIFNKKIYNQGPKVVVIGGGAGLNTVLRGLKNYTDNITAIVTVSDYGEEENISQKSLGTSELRDIEESIIALSRNENEMNYLLNLEFNNNNLKGLRFGDVYLTAMKEAVKDFASSIKECSKILDMTGKVLPVTLDKVKICAELADGTVVESRSKIPEVVSKKVSKIDRIYISPTNIRVAPGVIDAIKEADAIVIGPGSLYTNVIPNLLVPGVSKAIKEANGFKIYVSNIMTEYGQTDSYTLSEHIKAIINHAGKGIIDYCIYDTGEIVPEYVRQYNKEGAELVDQDTSKVKEYGVKLIQRNLSTIENGRIRHNSEIIATSIIQLICDDLKFRDMQNDAQFIMLDNKIKDSKRRMKKKNNNNKRKKENKKHTGSKFFEKYNDRIQSIRESEKKDKKKTKEKVVKSKENIIKTKPIVKLDIKDTLKEIKKEKEKEQEQEQEQIKKDNNTNFRATEAVAKLKSIEELKQRDEALKIKMQETLEKMRKNK